MSEQFVSKAVEENGMGLIFREWDTLLRNGCLGDVKCVLKAVDEVLENACSSSLTLGIVNELRFACDEANVSAK
jgi:hypothetical protein